MLRAGEGARSSQSEGRGRFVEEEGPARQFTGNGWERGARAEDP